MSATARLLRLSIVLAPLAAAGAQDAPIPTDAARAIFTEARAASDADGGALWGVDLYGPLLLVERRSRHVVANRADPGGLLSEDDGVFVGTLPDDTGIANTATDWSGLRWTMVMWPLPVERRARTRLLLHECFHRVQDDLGLPGGNPSNAHLETEGGRTWLRLEWRALSEALMQQGEARRAALADALLFRERRHALADDIAAEERALEMNEGLAEYTGHRLCGWPAGVLADRAAVRLERDEDSDSFARSFAYAVGPAYGVLFDESGVDWRTGLSADDDLGELLATAYDVTYPDDPADTATARAAAYDGNRVMAEEAERAERHAAVVVEYTQRFVEGPVLSLALGSEVRYGFNPNATTPLGAIGTVYASCDVRDAWGVLEADGGALLTRDAAGHMTLARVPAPADGGALRGDGWTLSLADGWTLVPGPREGDWQLEHTP